MKPNQITSIIKGIGKSIITQLEKGIPPIYLEDYDDHWNFTSFENKIILDLGADYGSTAYYFLKKGAKKVIAVEDNPKLYELLKLNFKNEQRVITIQTLINNAKQIEDLIIKYNPDIVKVDIEGEEINILQVDVKKVKEWLIETHSDKNYNALYEWFRKNGFNIKTFEYGINFKKFPEPLKIIYAYK